MKIVIDLTDLDDHITGIERYAMELSRELVLHDADFVLLFKNKIHPAFKHMLFKWNVKCKVIDGSGKLFFRQFVLPLTLYKLKADKYVFLAFPEPFLFFNKNIYTAVHDMSPWDCGKYMKFMSMWFFRLSNIHTFLFAKKIITISKFSASRICHYANVISEDFYKQTRSKLALIRCGVTYTKKEMSQREAVKVAVKEAAEKTADKVSTVSKNVADAVARNIGAVMENEKVKQTGEFIKDKALLVKDAAMGSSVVTSIRDRISKARDGKNYIVVDDIVAGGKAADILKNAGKTREKDVFETVEVGKGLRDYEEPQNENNSEDNNESADSEMLAVIENQDSGEQLKNKEKSVTEIYGIEGKYILSLSTVEARKNMGLLLKAYRKLAKADNDMPMLVIAGRKGWKADDLLKGFSDELKKKIVFTGFIEEEHLEEIYKNAECFVFTSLYEGFGMPPLEAMIHEVPVISSDAAAMPEILGDAVMYFKSNDSNDLTKKLKEFLSMEEADRQHLGELGKVQAEKYSWKNEAEKLARVLGIAPRNKA